MHLRLAVSYLGTQLKSPGEDSEGGEETVEDINSINSARAILVVLLSPSPLPRSRSCPLDPPFPSFQMGVYTPGGAKDEQGGPDEKMAGTAGGRRLDGCEHMTGTQMRAAL